MHRRDFIQCVGGGVIFAATAKAAWSAVTGDDVWIAPGQTEPEVRRKALSYAILAPNPHNMQPWLVDLSTPDEVVLRIDPTRLLPVTDPFDRQITIGCGAFIELFCLAAGRLGRRVEVSAFPEGEPDGRLDHRPIARMRLSEGATPAPLFSAITQRRTNRNAHRNAPVSQTQIAELVGAATTEGLMAGGMVQGEVRDKLRDLTLKAMLIEQSDRAANNESADRTFLGAREVAAHPWGIPIRGGNIEWLIGLGVVSRDGLKTPGSLAFKGQTDMMRQTANSTQAYGWIVSSGNRRVHQIAAGRAYARFALKAETLGLAIQPNSQALQEYAAMAGCFRDVHAVLAPKGGRIQMLARIGYADQVPHAPRRGLDPLIRSA